MSALSFIPLICSLYFLPYLFLISITGYWKISLSYFTAVSSLSIEASATIRLRKRRNVLNDTSTGITIHEVRKEISKHFKQLMPTKCCKSSEKVCPAGPPGYPELTGPRGPRGRRGPNGKKGPQGPMGPPGKSGKQDLLVPQDREEKREIGESLGQKACRDHLERVENRYLLHKWCWRQQSRHDMREEIRHFIARSPEILHQSWNGKLRA